MTPFPDWRAQGVIPALLLPLVEATRGSDLAAARAINDRMHPIVEAFYARPSSTCTTG
jgi:dihydrodipicolinate synthase/N-acetylneuraminate lyase